MSPVLGWDGIGSPVVVASRPIRIEAEGFRTMPKLFISYRREDSNDISGRIYDRLIQEFGKSQVFKDVYSIPLGSDFRTILSDAVIQCDVVLSIIGKRWLDVTDRAGKRRLESDSDFVRVELEAALTRGIPVIPVLVDGASVPAPDELPATLKELSFLNGAPVRYDPDFHIDMDRLVAGLKQIKRVRRPAGTNPADPTLALRRALFSPPTLVIVVLILCVIGGYIWWKNKPDSNKKDTSATVAGPVAAPVNSAPTPPARANTAPPPEPTIPVKENAELAENAAITALFDKMQGQESKDSLDVGLWIASPITKRDLPIFEALAKSMRVEGARLTWVSIPDRYALKGLDKEIAQNSDARTLLNTVKVNAVIIYGIYRDDADVPALMKKLAPTPSRCAPMALDWCSEADYDSFLIVPDGDPFSWKTSQFDEDQITYIDKAVDASLKHHTISAVGNVAYGNDFGEFFKSVKSRAPGPSQITSVKK